MSALWALLLQSERSLFPLTWDPIIESDHEGARELDDFFEVSGVSAHESAHGLDTANARLRVDFWTDNNFSFIIAVFLVKLTYYNLCEFFRCKIWVDFCQREDLDMFFDKAYQYLRANHKLCADHFVDTDFENPVLKNR